jgi:Ran GTPase-activating protein (RanGAP) involved in mRNA processing and transport
MSLAFCLERNDTLTELYLDYNQINAEGGAVLANALQTNGSLRVLQLNSNQLHDKGALAFGTMLANHNTSLKRLCLSQNRITSWGAMSLIQAMETNVTLHHLEMSKNQLDPVILGTLELAMQTNRSGRYLLRQERVPLSLWPRVLARVSEQPDMLYYFLQATQHLICAVR